MGLPFKIRTTGRSLFVTFDRLCQVVSWAPLLGGFRSNVSHILFEEAEPGRTRELDTALRRSSSCLGLKGTVVGLSASVDVRSQKIVSASNDKVQVCVLAMRGRLGAIEGSGSAKQQSSLPGSATVLIWMDRRLNHETMLEAMALGVEVRAKIGEQQWRLDESSERHGNLRGPEPVVVASRENSGVRFRGNHEELRALVVRALVECLSA